MTERTVGLTEARRHLGALLDFIQDDTANHVEFTRYGEPTGVVMVHPDELDMLDRIARATRQG